MPFSLDYSKPQRKPFIKRFPVLIPLFVFFLIILGYTLIYRSQTAPLIGVVQIEGVILESEGVITKLRGLEKNPLVKGIILRINSPGGAVAPSQEIFTELLRIRKKKKIYTSISSVAASGGYYIAIGSEKIFANPGSLTGSIGVIMQTFNVQKLMNKVGVQIEIIKAGKNKDIGSIFRPMKNEERKLLESVLQNTHKQFINAVVENRPINRNKVEALADGRVYTGKQAFDLGLIDGLASFRETIEQMKSDLGLASETKVIFPSDKKEELLSILDLNSWIPFKKTFSYSGLFFLDASLVNY